MLKGVGQADSQLRANGLRGKVGSFCCSVLPKPPESASVARCGPNRAFVHIT